MRYPTSKSGLIISPYELGYTIPTVNDLDTKKRVTNHHGYYEKAWYQEKRYRQVFRSLIQHVYPMLAIEHNSGRGTLHEKYTAPVMPSDRIIIDVVDEYLALNGVITCVKESKTHEQYNIQRQNWDNIKQTYRSRNG